jgi:acetyl esterase/lipase
MSRPTLLRTAGRALYFITSQLRRHGANPFQRAALPVVEEEIWVGEGRQRARSLLYRPAAAGPWPGAAVLDGVSKLGIEDPRLIHFARSTAACGFVALTVDLPDMRRYFLALHDVKRIVRAFRALRARPEVDPQNLGIIGFCFGASFSLLAAAELGPDESVGWIGGYGGYYDFGDVIHYGVTGAYPAGQSYRVAPDPYVRKIYFFNHLHHFELPPAQEEALRTVLLHDLRREPDELARSTRDLPPAVREVYRQIVTPSDPAAASLFERARAEVPNDFIQFNVAPRLPRIQVGRVYLLHARDDAIIPAPETGRLAQALRGAGIAPVQMHITSLFAHVNPHDQVRFWRDTVPGAWGLLRFVLAAVRPDSPSPAGRGSG